MKFFKFSFTVFCLAGIFLFLFYLSLPEGIDKGEDGKVSIPQSNEETVVPETIVATSLATNQIPPLDAYYPIIDRIPFGQAPSVLPTPPDKPLLILMPEGYTRSVQIQAVFKNTEGRTAVVYSNRAFNPVKYIYLEVGETKDDVLLVEADILAQTATLKKGGHAITLKVGE